MQSVKSRRSLSFLVLTVLYVLAAAGGVWFYRLLPGPFWLRLLLADVAATAFIFVFSCIFRNASVYDPYWSVQPIVIVWGFALGQTLTPLRMLLLFAVTVWGCRLTANWAYTFHGLTHQDWRYTHYEQTTGRLYPLINFTGIHLVPTLIVYACTLPVVFALQYDCTLHPLSIVFSLLSVCAFTLQAAADVQMHSFRLRRQAGQTGSPFIREGLWRNSRHPNYLGEILMWWGVGLCAVCSMPHRWYLLLGAVANTVLFLTVSIPLADRRQSTKPGAADYMAHTRRLLPLRK